MPMTRGSLYPVATIKSCTKKTNVPLLFYSIASWAKDALYYCIIIIIIIIASIDDDTTG
jgi:hypothetical protein